MPLALDSHDFIFLEKFLVERLILDINPLFSIFCLWKVSTCPFRISCRLDEAFLVRYVQLKVRVIMTQTGTRWNMGLIVIVTGQLVPGNWKLHCKTDAS